MKPEERIAILETELNQMKEEVKDLLKWKSSCNLLMAGWGTVCMFCLSIGTAIVHYYGEIKAYLLAAWTVK